MFIMPTYADRVALNASQHTRTSMRRHPVARIAATAFVPQPLVPLHVGWHIDFYRNIAGFSQV
jgi:hypothetical protein